MADPPLTSTIIIIKMNIVSEQVHIKPTYLEIYFLYLDIDECALKTDNCNAHATCENTEGSFNCSCKPGLTGNGTSCADKYNIP